MPTDHVKRRKAVMETDRRADVERAISEANLEEIDREILKMHYVQSKPWGYIADVKGYSTRQIVRRHKAALVKIVAILAINAKNSKKEDV